MTESELRERLAAKGGWRELVVALRALPNLAALVVELERIAEADAEDEVRYKARKTLSVLGERPAARANVSGKIAIPPPLGKLAGELQGRDAEARGRVLERFAQAHRAAGVDELVAQLGVETDPAVLSAVVRLVGTCGSPSHLRDLRPFLSHANQRVVANAVEAMGRLDEGAALPMVLPALVADDHRVRANVLMVLYGTWKPEVLAYLSRMTVSPKESYRASAIWCLGQIEDVQADEALAQMLSTEESADLADTIFQVFATKRGAAAIPLLLRVTQDLPHRAGQARAAVSAIAARTGVSGEQLQDMVGRMQHEPSGSPTGLSKRLQRITRSFRAVLLSQRARAANEASSRPIAVIPDAASHARRLAFVAAGVIALLVGMRLTSEERAPAPRPAAPRVEDAAAVPVNPGGLARFVATVTDRADSTLVVEKDRTVYALHFKDARSAEGYAAGARVFVTARFRAWNAIQRRVEMDVESVAPAR